MKITPTVTAYTNQSVIRFEEFVSVAEVAKRVEALSDALDIGDGAPFSVAITGTWRTVKTGDPVSFNGGVEIATISPSYAFFVAEVDGAPMKLVAHRDAVVVVLFDRGR